jgi:hypothetical protein
MAACFYVLSGFGLPGVREIGHLVFVILMGFVSFGSVATLFASVIGVAPGLLSFGSCTLVRSKGCRRHSRNGFRCVPYRSAENDKAEEWR